MPHVPFASEFPAASYAQWRALAEKAMPHAMFETPSGVPLYQKALNPPSLLGGSPGWAVVQRVDAPDPINANALALADLENGANGLVLLGAETIGARGFGLPSFSAEILSRVLDGVFLDLITLRLDAGPAAAQAAMALRDYAMQRGLPPEGLGIDFGIDPVGVMAWTGAGAVDGHALEIAATLATTWTGSRTCLADGRPYHEAGAPPARELACVVATALFYLRALEKAGIVPDKARRSLSFLLVTDADVFLTLTKFRALRFIWARVEEACGLSPLPIRLHAETSWRMMTRQKPESNIIRATLAAFAAGVGGADTITILPHTLTLGLPDLLARRTARNTQLILQAEAGLARVADPAAGSGAFEDLTQSLCAQAWEIFQSIEKSGGMPEALRTGMIRDGSVGLKQQLADA